MRHTIQMADAWGVAFLEHVYSPVLDLAGASIETRLERIEQEARHLREEVISGGHMAGAAKKISMIIAMIAVVGTMTPSDIDMARPRPPTSRTRRFD